VSESAFPIKIRTKIAKSKQTSKFYQKEAKEYV